ncbi:peptide deformylase [Bacteroidota bacterium]
MPETLDKILKIGHPDLYRLCDPVRQEEISGFGTSIELMGECIIAFRKKYGQGRAIAAPQVGIQKRIIVINIDRPYPIYNPEFIEKSDQMVEIWDDCMSFPELFVKVQRHYSLKMRFRDENWEEQVWELEGDMAELLQHEYDHLDGILATMRAIDEKSFKWREPKNELP